MSRMETYLRRNEFKEQQKEVKFTTGLAHIKSRGETNC